MKTVDHKLLPIDTLQLKLSQIKLFVFDWDGVFNDGFKSDKKGSGFSEVDAMGTNLLRFSQFIKAGSLPKSLILTGLNNQLASEFAQREHFDAVYLGFKDKKVALEHIKSTLDVQDSEIAFFYDDVLDLSVAKEVGLRLYIKDESKFMLNKLIIDDQLAEYQTQNKGGHGGLREACEVLMTANKNYELAIDHRIRFDATYQDYLKQRNTVSTKAYTTREGQIVEI